jgi:FeS assembly SUF system protein
MRWFRRKSDGEGSADAGTHPATGRGGAAGDGAAALARPAPPSTVHPMDAVALGLDRLGIASPGVDERQGDSAGVSAAAPRAASGAASGPTDAGALRDAIVEVLRTVYDPEIPVNIYEIGLIYQLDVSPKGEVSVRMTLTSPMCPVAESLPPEVEAKIAGVPGVTDVKLDLVWEPPWTPAMMSEEARLLLNIG